MSENKQEDVLSLDEDTYERIQLVSKDSKIFEIDRRSSFLSTLVKICLENDASSTEVPIMNVNSEILELVVEYMNHHKGVEPRDIDKPLRSKIMTEVCEDSWDANFIDRVGGNSQQLTDLVLAANYMDINSLINLGCAKKASFIMGLPLQKIKDIISCSSEED
jgi:S-phase kinase-associated protein 1